MNVLSVKTKNPNMNAPNVITSLRIIGSAVLLFTEPFSAAFYIIYTLCGLSDVLDGFIARRFHMTSTLGARLDSIADLMFYAAMLLKVLPTLLVLLPTWIWLCVAGVIIIRIAAYITAAVKFHCFASMHTYMNKATGGAVFCVPYIVKLPCAVPLCFAVCVIAALSSLEELLMHLVSKEYHEGVKTIFALKKAQ